MENTLDTQMNLILSMIINWQNLLFGIRTISNSNFLKARLKEKSRLSEKGD